MMMTLQPTVNCPNELSASHASAASMQIELRHHTSDITLPSETVTYHFRREVRMKAPKSYQEAWIYSATRDV